MASIEMGVSRYYPRRERKWQRNDDGSFEAEIYTNRGVVRIFTFVGDDHHGAFTSLEMFIDPYVYTGRLARYHTRWLCRLAYDFAWQCQTQSDAS